MNTSRHLVYSAYLIGVATRCRVVAESLLILHLPNPFMSLASSRSSEILSTIIKPEEVEAIANDALQGTFKKAGENLMHDFYDACNAFLHEHFANFESDIWRAISRQIIHGYADGKWSKYDHKDLRDSLFREHREEIIKELNQDLVAENEKLKKDLEWERTHRY